MMAYLFLIIAFTLNAAANLLLKVGSQKGVELSSYSPVALVVKNPTLALGLTLFALNVVFYYLALSRLPLSTAYPVMVAMSFLLVNLASLMYLRENITILQAAGYALVLVGITLVVSFAKTGAQ